MIGSKLFAHIAQQSWSKVFKWQIQYKFSTFFCHCCQFQMELKALMQILLKLQLNFLFGMNYKFLKKNSLLCIQNVHFPLCFIWLQFNFSLIFLGSQTPHLRQFSMKYEWIHRQEKCYMAWIWNHDNFKWNNTSHESRNNWCSQFTCKQMNSYTCT